MKLSLALFLNEKEKKRKKERDQHSTKFCDGLGRVASLHPYADCRTSPWSCLGTATVKFCLPSFRLCPSHQSGTYATVVNSQLSSLKSLYIYMTRIIFCWKREWVGALSPVNHRGLHQGYAGRGLRKMQLKELGRQSGKTEFLAVCICTLTYPSLDSQQTARIMHGETRIAYSAVESEIVSESDNVWFIFQTWMFYVDLCAGILPVSLRRPVAKKLWCLSLS